MAQDAELQEKLFGFLVWERGPFQVPERGGWKRFDEDCLHYLYVRQLQRNSGLARGLLQAAGRQINARHLYTFRTPDGQDLAAHLKLGLRYEPRLVRLPHVSNPPSRASNQPGYFAQKEKAS